MVHQNRGNIYPWPYHQLFCPWDHCYQQNRIHPKSSAWNVRLYPIGSSVGFPSESRQVPVAAAFLSSDDVTSHVLKIVWYPEGITCITDSATLLGTLCFILCWVFVFGSMSVRLWRSNIIIWANIIYFWRLNNLSTVTVKCFQISHKAFKLHNDHSIIGWWLFND